MSIRVQEKYHWVGSGNYTVSFLSGDFFVRYILLRRVCTYLGRESMRLAPVRVPLQEGLEFPYQNPIKLDKFHNIA